MTYYASLKNGVILRAENALLIDGKVVDSPTREQYLHAGYKPVVFTDPPKTDDGYHAVTVWVEGADRIEQKWEVVEDKDDPTDTDKAEAYDILMGVSD